MQFKLDNEIYDIIIEKKHIKNTYIRVKPDLNIYVTTNYLMNKHMIENILNKNINYIRKMVIRQKNKKEKELNYYYLGNKYDIVVIPQIDKVSVSDNKIFINDINYLDKWYKVEAERIFNERLNYILTIFKESIPTPKLRIRNMTTRWGVCNYKKNIITLNLELIKKDIASIDYVIVHELCHFVYQDHSKHFWLLVEKYIPNCKAIRKRLKEV
jgi:predicted metal-dependent hydrolase